MTRWTRPARMALFLALSLAAFAANAERDPVEQEVLDAQAARLQATIDADIETLATYLADDLSYSHNTGWSETKSEYLATVATAKLDYLSAERRDVEVRVYGDVAVVTGLADMTGRINGETVALTIRFLEVSRRVDGSWQLTAWQSVRYTGD